MTANCASIFSPLRAASISAPASSSTTATRLTPMLPCLGGNTFTLNNTTYTSDPSDPINGTGKVDFVKAGPMFTVGWGNLLPRNHHHFSVPVELGVIYTSAPRTTVNLDGSACDATGLICFSTTSNPTFQANVQAEQNKLNNDMSAIKFYPVISAGFGFSFEAGLFGASRASGEECSPRCKPWVVQAVRD
jgi:hypothetical protein